MEGLFKNIKAVGFDLDQTLYESNALINERISYEVARAVLKMSPSLENVENARNFIEEKYRELGSRTRALKAIGCENAEEVMYDCFTKADFVDLLKRDEALKEIIERLNYKYLTFLITGTHKNLAVPRLQKLGLGPNLFKIQIYGETWLPAIKIDGSIFKKFIAYSKLQPGEHVYIGDNLKADILPAKSVGMLTIALGKDIEEAHYSIRKIHDIERILL